MAKHPSRGPTDRDLPLRLHAAMLHMMRLIRRADDALGISAPRLSALSLVGFGGSRTIGEMAAAEQVTPPTMTRLVAALEAEGLVRREPDRRDGRIVRVTATSRGRRVMEDGRRKRVRFLAAAIEGLSADERRALDVASDVLMRVYLARTKSVARDA